MTPEALTQYLAGVYMDGRSGRSAEIGDVQIEQRLDARLTLTMPPEGTTWTVEGARAAVAYLQGWITAQDLIAAGQSMPQP